MGATSLKKFITVSHKHELIYLDLQCLLATEYESAELPESKFLRKRQLSEEGGSPVKKRKSNHSGEGKCMG